MDWIEIYYRIAVGIGMIGLILMIAGCGVETKLCFGGVSVGIDEDCPEVQNKINAKETNLESNNKKTEPNVQVEKKIIPLEIESIEGTYLNYKYTTIYQKEDDKYGVLFEPPLVRSDILMIGAMTELINTVYGKHLLVDLTPQFTERNGVNLIAFRGTNHRFLFLIAKNEFGEIYYFIMWRENL